MISNESPMGHAVLGRSKGDPFEFEAPDGKKKYRVVDIRK
jgi:transcription elongation factor GreA